MSTPYFVWQKTPSECCYEFCILGHRVTGFLTDVTFIISHPAGQYLYRDCQTALQDFGLFSVQQLSSFIFFLSSQINFFFFFPQKSRKCSILAETLWWRFKNQEPRINLSTFWCLLKNYYFTVLLSHPNSITEPSSISHRVVLLYFPSLFMSLCHPYMINIRSLLVNINTTFTIFSCNLQFLTDWAIRFVRDSFHV